MRFIICLLSIAVSIGWSQNLGSLKRVVVPQPVGLEKYVRDRTALMALGKALFWDMQVGSDNKVACASCHFHAGADHRSQNQLKNLMEPFAVNHALKREEFPLRVFSNPGDNRSSVLRDSAAVVGSSGVFERVFADVATPSDEGRDAEVSQLFNRNNLNVRRVTGRNSPSVINSVFYVRNFWDGRARTVFTGFTPFGDSDTRANAVVVADGILKPEKVRIDTASLASQAVGPPLNDVEMSYAGRTWPKLGKRMLALRPLAQQRVAVDDSVLGQMANVEGPGLKEDITYLAMVQAAFQPAYWDSPQLVDGEGKSLDRQGPAANTNEFLAAEYNFALIFGLAVQAYETTLVSDDAPWDRFSEGTATALTAQQQDGLRIFNGIECANCHSGPEFTLASFSGAGRGGRNVAPDIGFFRTGVRPAAEDIGVAALDDFGKPLSFAMARNPSDTTSNGSFKTPTIRNIEFTGPYFHNGGQATLEEVMEFYDRGGDFPGGNFGPDVFRRNLSRADRVAVVEFMKSLSDDRVKFERAPFDHPELCVAVSHVESDTGELMPDTSDSRFTRTAAERWAAIPAVGKAGNTAPLQTFEELLHGIGNDGSRTHTLTETCRIQ